MAWVRQFDYSVTAVEGGGSHSYNHFRKPEPRAERLRMAQDPRTPLQALMDEFNSIAAPAEEWEIEAAKIPFSPALDGYDPYNTMSMRRAREARAVGCANIGSDDPLENR